MEWERRWHPESVPELLQHLHELRQVHFWRGSADASWPLDSTVVRRIRNHRHRRLSAPSERRIGHEEQTLLRRARHQGYDLHRGVRLSDLELLVLLRHHGAATRLIDFSRSASVALWFACCSHPGVGGELIGVSADHVWGSSEGEPLELETEADAYEDLMAEVAASGGLWQWQPTDVSSRVAAQHSQLLFSGFVDEPHGSVALPSHSEAVVAIDIPAGLKPAILRFLKNALDIRHLSMFPDLQGFSESYATDRSDDDRW